MKYLYKYPQKEYPYMDLIQTNKSRDRFAFEYELMEQAFLMMTATLTSLLNTPKNHQRIF